LHLHLGACHAEISGAAIAGYAGEFLESSRNVFTLHLAEAPMAEI
jgi:hypothetical protein